MNVGLFYRNLSRIDALLTSLEITAHYTALLNLVVEYRTAPTPIGRQALDKAIDELQLRVDKLVAGLSEIPHSNLLLEELHVPSLLAMVTQKVSEFVFADLFSAQEGLQTMINEVQTFKSTATAIVAGMAQLKYEGLNDSEATNLFTVEFLGETEIDDLDQLLTNGDKLKKILYNYACLSPETAEFSPKIDSIAKGSPVVIDITWLVNNLPVILKLIGLTVLFYLSKKEEKIKYTEMEQMVISQVPADKIPKSLKTGFGALKDGVLSDQDIQKHVDELVKEVDLKSNDRTPAEQKNFLLKGVRDLVDLLDSGARVEVHQTKTDEAAQDEGSETATNTSVQTTIIYTKYKQIEQKTSLLQGKFSMKLPKMTTEITDEEAPAQSDPVGTDTGPIA